MARNPDTRYGYRRVCKPPALSRPQLASLRDGAKTANAEGKDRTINKDRAINEVAALGKGHQKVLSAGELFIRALTVQHDLSRRILKEPGSEALLEERHEHERLVSQLALEYKNAIAEYLVTIRAPSKH